MEILFWVTTGLLARYVYMRYRFIQSRKIKSLRQTLKEYKVSTVNCRISEWDTFTVRGLTPVNAAIRYAKRKHLKNTQGKLVEFEETNSGFADIRIVPSDKPFERFATYWK